MSVLALPNRETERFDLHQPAGVLGKKFWLTEFSHLGGGGNPTKSNLVLVTKAAKDKPFNLDELKPLNKLKLKDILK